jgi:sigma-B regulation protein RsbU (phosphoserine phosphatase)
LRSGLDLVAVLNDVLCVILRAVDAESAAILLREGEALVVRAVLGERPEWREGVRLALRDGLAADGRSRLIDAHGPHDRGLAGVPLVLDGTVHGTLQVRARPGSSFTDADLRLLTPAAERAALAISRAQLLERERGIAETLQRALLPQRLPDVPGLRLSAHFEPATGTVGGDWYDAVRLDSGELALAIGDVAGKGIPAAALMGELRGGLRAGVLDGGEPNEMLRRLDRLAERAGRMATVLLVLLDPDTGAMRFSSAGHLPPLLVEPGGAARFLAAGASPPLLAFNPSIAPGTATLAPGARLLLYTDGLVERRTEPIDVSLRRLTEAAAAHAGDVAGLVAAMMPPAAGLRDDIAVLTVVREH